MSWSGFGWTLLIITAGNLLALLWSQEAELWMYALLLGATIALAHAWRLTWKRRVAQLRESAPDVVEGALAQFSSEDRALARLELGLVTSSDADVDPLHGERFELPRTPESLRNTMVWGCIAMAGLVLILEVVGESPADTPITTLVLSAFFLGGAALFNAMSRWEGGAILMTSSGIVQVKPNASRVGILWSEVAWIRRRRFLMCLDIWARDGRRRIRVSYAMPGFARFMELLVAHALWWEERAV